MKTKAELNALKEEFETLGNKLQELTEDELRLVIGGSILKSDIDLRKDLYENIILGNGNSEK